MSINIFVRLRRSIDNNKRCLTKDNSDGKGESYRCPLCIHGNMHLKEEIPKVKAIPPVKPKKEHSKPAIIRRGRGRPRKYLLENSINQGSVKVIQNALIPLILFSSIKSILIYYLLKTFELGGC